MGEESRSVMFIVPQARSITSIGLVISQRLTEIKTEIRAALDAPQMLTSRATGAINPTVGPRYDSAVADGELWTRWGAGTSKTSDTERVEKKRESMQSG